MAQNATTTVHAGPAGSTFYGIEHAGRHALKTNCDNYPQTTNSYILPPLFIANYPEGHDPATSKPKTRPDPPLSTNEQRTFDGICTGQSGERIEYKVFNLFTKLLAKRQDHPMLILRDFELSTKGKFNLKQTTFMSEYPHIPKISMRGEADYIVLLKDLGFVAIEVKRTLSLTSLQKAKYQLYHSEFFLNQVMPAATQLNSQCFPIAKLIIFEMEDPQAPLASNSSIGYHYFDCSGDSIVAFEQKWKDIIQELQTNTPPNPLMPFEFKRLARLLTGLWSLKSMNRQPYFDVDDASLPHLTKQVDVSVNHAQLVSAGKKRKLTNDPPVTNVVYNQPETVFRKANEINLMYLTPQQQNIFDNVQRGLIRGPAGTGKTLLVLFKIIDLVQSPNNNKKILLLAPHPHTIRCKNILQANNVVVVNSEEYSRGQPHDVVIMDEFSIVTSVFFSFHHVFIDDFQNVKGILDDVGRTIETLKDAYELASHNLSYFWCMVDGLQDRSNTHSASQLYLNLLPDTNGNRRRATIPVYCLENILRNTQEISTLVLRARNSTISYAPFPHVDAHVSHKITSTLPTYHVLMPPTTNINACVDFTIERLEDELRQLVRVMNPTSCPSDIAILCSDNLSTDLVMRVKELLSRTFNIVPMAIERQLETQSPAMVLDHVMNATSGEWPVVIYIQYNDVFTPRYLAYSRARTRLIVIKNSYIQDYQYTSDAKLVKWKRENNRFVQC